MIPLLLWAAGTAAFSWLMWAHGYFRAMLPMVASFWWVVWVFGGAIAVPRFIKHNAGKVRQKREWESAARAAAGRESAERQQREAKR
jgi:hypothetical protein